MRTKLDTHGTQWTAQFAVASELCKQGYKVAFTMGNHPIVDLMVQSPRGREFVIDVKGQKGKGFWQINKQQTVPRLRYVFAYVPIDGNNEFFLMTQAEVEKKRATYLNTAYTRKRRRGTKTKVGSRKGLPFAVVQNFRAKPAGTAHWRKLPK